MKSQYLDEFTIKAGKGAKRKAIKTAFQNLLLKGIRNYTVISVFSKRNDPIYEVTIYVNKETSVMEMKEFKWNKGNYKGVCKTVIHRNDPRIPNEVRNWY